MNMAFSDHFINWRINYSTIPSGCLHSFTTRQIMAIKNGCFKKWNLCETNTKKQKKKPPKCNEDWLVRLIVPVLFVFCDIFTRVLQSIDMGIQMVLEAIIIYSFELKFQDFVTEYSKDPFICSSRAWFFESLNKIVDSLSWCSVCGFSSRHSLLFDHTTLLKMNLTKMDQNQRENVQCSMH